MPWSVRTSPRQKINRTVRGNVDCYVLNTGSRPGRQIIPRPSQAQGPVNARVIACLPADVWILAWSRVHVCTGSVERRVKVMLIIIIPQCLCWFAKALAHQRHHTYGHGVGFLTDRWPMFASPRGAVHTECPHDLINSLVYNALRTNGCSSIVWHLTINTKLLLVVICKQVVDKLMTRPPFSGSHGRANSVKCCSGRLPSIHLAHMRSVISRPRSGHSYRWRK